MKIVIEGNPIPLQRARAFKSGFYDPQFIAKRNYASVVKEQYKKAPIETPIVLELTFLFEMPKSWSKKKKEKMKDTPHTGNKDIDNLTKYVLDSLNEVIWIDDCIIYRLFAEKRWAEKGSTIIEF